MRTVRRVMTGLLTVLIAAGVVGCRREADGGEPARGSSQRQVEVDGAQRPYRLYLAPDLSLAVPVALVLMAHGGFGNAEQAEESYGWKSLADREGFVVAYPEGLGRAWSVGGDCCGEPGRLGRDDVGYIEAVVADISEHLPIDASRIFVTGMSNGGMLSYRLACDSTLFAAIAPVAATLMGECASPKPVSLLHIHGLDDTRVRYDGGQGTGVGQIDGAPVESSVDIWRVVNGCVPPAVQTDGPVTTSRSGCPSGREVTLITIAGSGHQWPGSGGRSLAQRVLGADEPSADRDATEEIWRFFSAHPRPV